MHFMIFKNSCACIHKENSASFCGVDEVGDSLETVVMHAFGTI